MNGHRTRFAASVAAAITSLATLSMAAGGEMSPMKPPADHVKAPPPIRATMEELHAHGGVPPGWKFLMPPGDASEGRKAFVSMECYACHAVRDESFPKDSKTPRGSGPDLTGMGSHHPAEYFAESILNPNRVIVQGTGYTGEDGLSKMPSYADTMTLKQLVDVVAYLKSLSGGDDMAHMHSATEASKDHQGTMHMK